MKTLACIIACIVILFIINCGCGNNTEITSPVVPETLASVSGGQKVHWQGVDDFLTRTEYRVEKSPANAKKQKIYVKRYLDRHTDMILVVSYPNGCTKCQNFYEPDFTWYGDEIMVNCEVGTENILCVYQLYD